MTTKELIKGEIYIDITDKRVPLLFTGRKVKKNDTCCIYFLCFFTTVRTDDNKNWYQKRNKSIIFYNDLKNDRISKIKNIL